MQILLLFNALEGAAETIISETIPLKNAQMPLVPMQPLNKTILKFVFKHVSTTIASFLQNGAILLLVIVWKPVMIITSVIPNKT